MTSSTTMTSQYPSTRSSLESFGSFGSFQYRKGSYSSAALSDQSILYPPSQSPSSRPSETPRTGASQTYNSTNTAATLQDAVPGRILHLPERSRVAKGAIIQSQYRCAGAYDHPILVVRCLNDSDIVEFFPVTSLNSRKLDARAKDARLSQLDGEFIDRKYVELGSRTIPYSGPGKFSTTTYANLQRPYYARVDELLTYRDCRAKCDVSIAIKGLHALIELARDAHERFQELKGVLGVESEWRRDCILDPLVKMPTVAEAGMTATTTTRSRQTSPRHHFRERSWRSEPRGQAPSSHEEGKSKRMEKNWRCSV